MKLRFQTLIITCSLLIALIASIVFMSQAKSFRVITDGRDFFFIGPGSAGEYGEILTRGENGEINFRVSTALGNPNNGFMSVRGSVFGRRAIDILSSPSGDSGRIQIHDGTSDSTEDAVKIDAFIRPDTSGAISIDGANNRQNAYIGSLSSDRDSGHLYVSDTSGTNQAGLFVNSSGDGEVYADIKAFVEDHPTQPPGTKIVYISLEGPEAAMFFRGKASLVNGIALVELPEHFTALAALDTATVQLTPHSGQSFGLAVNAVNPNFLEIVELSNGSGSYDFSFNVTATREKYLGHEPVVTSGSVDNGQARHSSSDRELPILSGLVTPSATEKPVD